MFQVFDLIISFTLGRSLEQRFIFEKYMRIDGYFTPPSVDSSKSSSFGVDGMIFAGFGGSGIIKED